MAKMDRIVEDLKDERVPPCLYWTTQEVADWITELGFPFYKACFQSNFIDGRKLICIDASELPNIGVKDFEHIKSIAKAIRDLLTLTDPDCSRSISLVARPDLGMYLERKSKTGKTYNALNYKIFLLNFSDKKWKPPLSNQCLLLPRS